MANTGHTINWEALEARGFLVVIAAPMLQLAPVLMSSEDRGKNSHELLQYLHPLSLQLEWVETSSLQFPIQVHGTS